MDAEINKEKEQWADYFSHLLRAWGYKDAAEELAVMAHGIAYAIDEVPVELLSDTEEVKKKLDIINEEWKKHEHRKRAYKPTLAQDMYESMLDESV